MKLLKKKKNPGWQVFCYYTSGLPPSPFIPLSPRLQRWQFGPWLLPTQHQSQDAAVGAAGLLTGACLLKSGISQTLLHNNEIHEEGSGRGFFLLNTKPARVKLFRRGQDMHPELAVHLLDRLLTGAMLGSLWNAMLSVLRAAQRDVEEKESSVWQTQVTLFFSPWSFHVQPLCSKSFFNSCKTSLFTEAVHGKACCSHGNAF